jgi:hypothetical protein
MHDVSLVRLYVLRATYLVIALGLFLTIWPLLLDVPPDIEHFRSATWALLGALALLAALGVRYPLRMLPVLLFELAWKVVWVVLVGLPRWRAGTLEGAFSETWTSNLAGIVICTLAIPWGHVAREYLRAPGDRWRRGQGQSTRPQGTQGSREMQERALPL